MRRILLCVGNFLLILSAVFCTLCSIISAFDFEVRIHSLFYVWLTACFVISVLATLWRGKGLLACLPPVLILLYLNLPSIISGGKWVMFFISSVYKQFFPSSVLFPGATAAQSEITIFFAAAGIILALLLSSAICISHSTFYTFLFTFPIVAFSLLIEDFAPNPWLQVVLLAVYITMMVSSAFHPSNSEKRGFAFFPALALAGLLLGITYLVAPPAQYIRSNRVVSLDSRINNAFSKGGFNWEQLGINQLNILTNGWRFNKEFVAVADAGARTETGKTVLNVTASKSGTYYLRGYSMQIFDGRAWNNESNTSSPSDYQSDAAWPLQIAKLFGTWYPDDTPEPIQMHVDKHGDRSDMLYLPYYAFSGSDSDASSESYDIEFYHIERTMLHYASALTLTSDFSVFGYSEYNAEMRNAYTQIDPVTAEGLRELAAQAGIDADTDRAAIADQVADYISSSARYTLSPPLIPANEDFVLYFLETTKAGYCVHFATAATLMLRALDIPARFTSGFTVTINADGGTAAVTDRQAHSWVEVYYDDVGWAPLEVTPSSASSQIPERNPHTSANVPSHVTNPTETAPVSEAPEVSPGGTSNQNNSTASTGTGNQDYRLALYAVVCAALVTAFLYFRRRIARASRKKRFGQADTNAAVICAWQYITRLHGKKGSPPDFIEESALKARFSRHHLSEEERAAVIDYALELSQATDRRLNPLKRFWLRYIRGLY